jgi:hypothetical protein
VSEFLEKTLISIRKHWKKLKKIFKKLRKFGVIFFDARSIFVFFEKQKFPWKFARGKRMQGVRSYAI